MVTVLSVVLHVIRIFLSGSSKADRPAFPITCNTFKNGQNSYTPVFIFLNPKSAGIGNISSVTSILYSKTEFVIPSSYTSSLLSSDSRRLFGIFQVRSTKVSKLTLFFETFWGSLTNFLAYYCYPTP